VGSIHTAVANTDGATYGYWLEWTNTEFRVNVVTTGGIVTAIAPLNLASSLHFTLLQLTLTAANILEIYVNGSGFVTPLGGGDTYIPAPPTAIPTFGVRDVGGTNPLFGLLSGAAYNGVAINAALVGAHYAACTNARDMVDAPSGYGSVLVPSFTNLWSARRGNNGQGEPEAFPGVPLRRAHATWTDEHGLVPLTREGTLAVATIIHSV